MEITDAVEQETSSGEQEQQQLGHQEQQQEEVTCSSPACCDQQEPTICESRNTLPPLQPATTRRLNMYARRPHNYVLSRQYSLDVPSMTRRLQAAGVPGPSPLNTTPGGRRRSLTPPPGVGASTNHVPALAAPVPIRQGKLVTTSSGKVRRLSPSATLFSIFGGSGPQGNGHTPARVRFSLEEKVSTDSSGSASTCTSGRSGSSGSWGNTGSSIITISADGTIATVCVSKLSFSIRKPLYWPFTLFTVCRIYFKVHPLLTKRPVNEGQQSGHFWLCCQVWKSKNKIHRGHLAWKMTQTKKKT